MVNVPDAEFNEVVVEDVVASSNSAPHLNKGAKKKLNERAPDILSMEEAQFFEHINKASLETLEPLLVEAKNQEISINKEIAAKEAQLFWAKKAAVSIKQRISQLSPPQQSNLQYKAYLESQTKSDIARAERIKLAQSLLVAGDMEVLAQKMGVGVFSNTKRRR